MVSVKVSNLTTETAAFKTTTIATMTRLHETGILIQKRGK